ncbi:type II toxin-antitoxin system death-on-curing family toxin [Desulfitobacterium sp. Sab5]|uniref:type II toxin-antitoxin system death-on-curing family toxin n=1 Tax=Desulfitobacterium nosdiversum TaxID=3375356 RepID=UPI003CEE7C5F
MRIQYLNESDLLAIHFVVIDDYFSEFKDDELEQRGIKDVSLFQSALHEPKQTFDKIELYPDVLSKGAVYLRSLALNHAFYNGNKRTALMAMIVFLEMNGYEVIAVPNRLYKFALAVVNTKPSIDHIKNKYLKRYTKYTATRNTGAKDYLGFVNFFRKITKFK